ncbi:dihydroneopterin aldolase, putative [Oceaniovalibus guishaninsula JLT2003]|uniref:dihydroneopterin aldolase n=1 Tax=Oceaniovalibus guishaninsula JLT2003 TaxID=1231392 RepID=K2HPG6_9RHOB|nr:dihydroneopterin aldolase [Oceaniovalibus guishaninsula]EKE44754.1 dihydroneopterin aldolase, putative [Oceaniovalibus guishaninsula JLT2003]
MADDTALAFQHPEARSRAGGGAPIHDRISLRDHIVEVEIGAFQPERGRTQRICFNVVVEVDKPDTRADDVDRILSYDTITDAIAAELKAERINLLETLADRIAARILAAPQALRCFVRIEKLDRGPGALGVEIVRSAADRPVAADAAETPRPLIVLLSNDAIASPHLTGWLDQLAARLPVVLTVGAAQGAVPRSASPAAQRRIDLLAIEQNAWILAGRDRRCLVVNTRTELDWAMRHGQMTVWAPSKIVLDSPGAPSVRAGDAPALAAWFADRMQARALLAIGPDAPDTALPLVRADPAADRLPDSP